MYSISSLSISSAVFTFILSFPLLKRITIKVVNVNVNTYLTHLMYRADHRDEVACEYLSLASGNDEGKLCSQ